MSKKWKNIVHKGDRVGTKRSDRRWKAPDGTIWASKFEYTVYDTLLSADFDVRKCGHDDTISYVEPRRNSRCVECGSDKVVQDRTYTPDLCMYQETQRGDRPIYNIETKGYFRAERRKLFREMVKSNPTYPIVVILERNGWVTKGKSRYLDYFKRYLKTVPVFVWNGQTVEHLRELNGQYKA